MSVADDVVTSEVARLLQPGVGFGPSFSLPRFDTPGSLSDPWLSDQDEQFGAGRQSANDPLRTQLQGVLEAELSRVGAGLLGGLDHQQPDQVVGQ